MDTDTRGGGSPREVKAEMWREMPETPAGPPPNRDRGGFSITVLRETGPADGLILDVRRPGSETVSVVEAAQSVFSHTAALAN